MYRKVVHRFFFTSAIAALAVGAVAVPAQAEDPPPYDVIASQLHNPRGLSVSADGDVYVAEAGSGGGGENGAETDGAGCLTDSEGDFVCSGGTGAVTRVRQDGQGNWAQDRVLTGLPSLAQPPSVGSPAAGGGAAGPSDVLVTGNDYAVVIGLGVGCGHPDGQQGPAEPTGPNPSCDPVGDNGLPDTLGTLVTGRLDSGLSPHVLASLADHEWGTNPVSNPDSNPVSVARDGTGYLVTDAGGNTLVHVSASGEMETIASFDSTNVSGPTPGSTLPMQFVPTAAARGPDGAWYVSQLTGFPFPKGGATIWRVVPGQPPQAYATGLTNVTDLAFAEDGALYAVELSTVGLSAESGPPQGALVKIPPFGGAASTVVDGLAAPYGVAIDGTDAYVTTGSIFPDGGAVIRVPITVNPLLGSLGAAGSLGSMGSPGSLGSSGRMAPAGS